MIFAFGNFEYGEKHSLPPPQNKTWKYPFRKDGKTE